MIHLHGKQEMRAKAKSLKVSAVLDFRMCLCLECLSCLCFCIRTYVLCICKYTYIYTHVYIYIYTFLFMHRHTRHTSASLSRSAPLCAYVYGTHMHIYLRRHGGPCRGQDEDDSLVWYNVTSCDMYIYIRMRS